MRDSLAIEGGKLLVDVLRKMQDGSEVWADDNFVRCNLSSMITFLLISRAHLKLRLITRKAK